ERRREDAGARAEAEGLRLPRRREEDGRGAVGDLRGRARRVDAAGLDGVQRRQLLERRLAEALVARHGLPLARRLPVLAEDRRVDRDHLARVAPLAPRGLRVALAQQPEAVRLLARDAVLLRDHLRALELARELVVVAVDLRQRAPALAVRAERHA